MNLIGALDRKARDLTMLLRKLEDAVAKFLIDLENCMKLGMALSKSIPYIMAAWQKDAVCIQNKFKDLFTAKT
jgi:hypothetical protein